MRNALFIFLISFLMVSCQRNIEGGDIVKLNGYWEIEKVIMPDGTPKEYPFNDTFDYYQISNGKGIRQKVMPQLDGTFLTNGISEKVSIAVENGKTYLKYHTPYAKWNEELIALSDKEMVVVNAEQKEYHYKKTTPINLIDDGKKAQ